jgi:hypothetical protein
MLIRRYGAVDGRLGLSGFMELVKDNILLPYPVLTAFHPNCGCLVTAYIRKYGAVDGRLGLAGFMVLMKDNMLLPNQQITSNMTSYCLFTAHPQVQCSGWQARSVRVDGSDERQHAALCSASQSECDHHAAGMALSMAS